MTTDKAEWNRLVSEAVTGPDAGHVIFDTSGVHYVPAVLPDPTPMPQRPLTGAAFSMLRRPIHPSVGHPLDEEPTDAD